MSKLQELIKKFCPDGVTYQSTSEIKSDSFWLMPATPDYIDNGVPYITAKNVRNNTIDFLDVKYISHEDYYSISANRKIEKNDLLITMIGTIGEAAFVGDFTEFYGQNMYLVRLNKNIINQKYYYYFLTSAKIKNGLISKKNASSQGYIKAGSIENLKVPVPPLPIQSEIVRILDIFTELIETLKVELMARKKQYECCQDKLLSFGSDVPIKKLADCCSLEKGRTPIQKAVAGEYPLVVTTATRKTANIHQFDSPTVCIPLVSSRGHGVASLNQVYYQEGKFALGNILCGATPYDSSDLMAEFLYYFLNFKKDVLLVPLMKGGANVSLTVDSLKGLKIPIPPYSVQKNIIEKLKCFENICNDISSEIEARTKQYEYYRDKLLTFKELS